MFTFADSIPANIRLFLIPFLQAWIDRGDHQLFGLETTRFGLVTFRRDPWPIDDVNPTTVAPAGEVDAAACLALSQSSDITVGGPL